MKTMIQTAPTTTMSPATIQVEKSIASSPKIASPRRQGSSRNTTSASPQPVNASRSGHAEPGAASGTRPMSTSETPRMNGVAGVARDAG